MDARNLPSEKIGTSGLIIYDGSCGACTYYIGEKRSFFERYGFSMAPLQEEWISELTGLDETTLLKAIHLLTPDGTILQGADFFDYLSGRVWWLAPIHALLRITPIKKIFTRLYNFVAKRRKKISQVCQLQSRAKYQK